MSEGEKTPGEGPAAPAPLPPRAGNRDLVFADPLQRYMQEIRAHPLLSREEEKAIAVRYQETADPDAAFQLITANLRLVVKIAMEYHHARVPVLDLVQEGNVGLMMAVKKYDPGRGVRFGSYAQWWIRAYILKFLMDNFALVKVGTTQAQRKLFYNLKKERARLEAQGIEATTEALADALDVRETEVVEMQKRLKGGGEVSIHTPLRDGESGELADLLSDDGMTAEQETAEAELSVKLSAKFNEFRKTLNDREKVFWEKRLLAEDPWTLQQLGDNFGVSRERARQVEARIVKNLKAFLTREIHDLEDLDLAMVGGG
jgi:RNA polymerase sigma-32 factor